MDYGLKHVIGNLLESDYWSLFASPEMNRLRIENQKNEFSKCSICKQCGNVLQYRATDNKLLGSRGYGPRDKVHFKDVVGYAKRKMGLRVSKK